MEKRFVKKGEILCHEGDLSHEMYFIESGAVAILCRNENSGENFPVTILRKGDLVGEFAFFDQRPRSATIMMVEDTHLKVIDRKVIEGIGKNGIFIIKALISKLRSFNEALKYDESDAA